MRISDWSSDVCSSDLKASVSSPYDGHEEERLFEITALASDPWEGLTVRFDGAAAQPWGEQTYFPRRQGEHVFALMAPADSPLFARALTHDRKTVVQGERSYARGDIGSRRTLKHKHETTNKGPRT